MNHWWARHVLQSAAQSDQSDVQLLLVEECDVTPYSSTEDLKAYLHVFCRRSAK